jgi:hypothetical protein
MRLSVRQGAAAALAAASFWFPPVVPAAAQQNAAAQTQAGAGRGRGGGGFREPDPLDFEDHTGFTQLFDGASLSGWDGNPDVWRVENGAIVGESTREKPAGNTFLVYRAAEAKDFDLKLEIKVEKGGGSGIQYRSHTGLPQNPNAGGNANPAAPVRDPRWTMIGPQMDFWLALNPNNSRYTGQLYSQNNGRGIIAWRGQVVESVSGKMTRLVGNLGDRAELGGYVKFADWNQLTMIVRGGTFIHILNGTLMAVLVDDDPASSNNVSGLFGLQIEGTPCKVSFRNIWLKKLS